MSRFACVIFDLDGTLVDSSQDIAAALNRILLPSGGVGITAAQVAPLLGEGVERLVEGALVLAGLSAGKEAIAEFCPRYLASYQEHPVVDTVLYPEVGDTLAALSAAGVAMGVCTNKSEYIAEQVLGRLQISGYFGSVIGGDRVPARKPDPAHLLAVFSALGEDPRSGVLVGDSPIDQQTAANAGVDFRAVEWAASQVTGTRLQPFSQLISLTRRTKDSPTTDPQAKEM